jgi:putative ABC transport system ATP-binding protein
VSSSLISIAGVSKSYSLGERRVDAVSDISFEVATAEMLALRGRSGSGKSTILNLVGLLATPDAGRIQLTDAQHVRHDTGLLNDSAKARIRQSSIGFVFQSFNLLAHLNAWQNVALAVPGSSGHARTQARLALEQVGLADRQDHRPSQLSGGEQQRVALARALVKSPRLILADEPTGNLDAANEGTVLHLLRAATDLGCAVLVATHSREVSAIADRVLTLDQGSLVEAARGERPSTGQVTDLKGHAS